MRNIFFDRWGYMRFGWIITFATLILGAVIFVAIWTIPAIDAPYQHRQCNRFEREAHRDTKFVKFSHWTYTCFVKVGDNNYVTIDQFRGAQVEK